MRRLIFVFGLLFILLGCGSESIKYDFPTTLLSTEYRVTSELKLFTKSGQISDKSIVDKYLAANGFGYFYSKIDTTLPLSSVDTIIYQYQDTVLFSEPGLWGKRIPKIESGFTYFYLTDTLIGYKTMDQSKEFKDIISQIGIYKPFYEDFGVSTGFPPSTMYQRVYDAKIAKGTPNLLEFPCLTYRLTRPNGNYSTVIARKNYNNIFDNNVVSLLKDGDTLAIQESKIIYKAVE